MSATGIPLYKKKNPYRVMADGAERYEKSMVPLNISMVYGLYIHYSVNVSANNPP